MTSHHLPKTTRKEILAQRRELAARKKARRKEAMRLGQLFGRKR